MTISHFETTQETCLMRAHMRAHERTRAKLGITCELTSRYQDFVSFWRENPVSARFALQTEARALLPSFRVSNCLRRRVSEREPVGVWHAPAQNKAHYGNLQTCALLWVCPVCAVKIAQRRLEDLQAGIAQWESAGNTVLMATFTLQHVITDSCAGVLSALLDAHKRVWSNRPGKRIKTGYKIAGTVKGLEVTYGANGWHWHMHALLFVAGPMPPNEVSNLRGDLGAVWLAEVANAGAFADGQHGFDVQQTSGYVGEYFTKHGRTPKPGQWSEAHEAALSPIKRAGNGGATPFELLAMSLAGDTSAGTLFVDYAGTVKGKSQLRWSRGLRALVGLGAEQSDTEIAAEQSERASLLARLDREHWRAIIGNAMRGELLKVASTGNSWLLLDLLESIGLGDVELPALVDDPNYHGVWSEK